MSYTVTSADAGKITLNETDTVKSVKQNIALLLAIRQGSCPFYRGFGLKQEFFDKPAPVARVLIFTELNEAIDEFEPRAELVDVSFKTDPNKPSKLIPVVEVNIREQSES